MNLIRVIQAEYLERFKIKLRFNDGTNGIVDLEKELYGQVFEPLKDLEFLELHSRHMDYLLAKWCRLFT